MSLFPKPKVTSANIANILGPNHLRIGVVVARKETRFFGLITSVLFCFAGKNKTIPSFHGWCKDANELEKWIMNKFPEAVIASASEFDEMLDAIERLMEK